MPSVHLSCLRNLLEYYVACRELAVNGDWEGLIKNSEEARSLFQELQQANSLLVTERAEAKDLLSKTLEADETIRSLANSWLTDVEPLLRTLNKRP